MIQYIGTWTDESTDEIKNRALILGRVIKDANYRTVGAKGTSMLTFAVSPGRGEPLVNIKMWGYDAVNYCETKKGMTILVDAYEDTREYGGRTYTDWIPLNVIAVSEAKGRAKKRVEPENPVEDVFEDLANTDDLPF